MSEQQGSKIDVAEFLRDISAEAGPDAARDAMRQVIRDAVPYAAALLDDIDRALRGADLETALRPIAELVSPLSEIQQEDWIRRVSQRFSVSRPALRRLVAGFGPSPEQREQAERAKAREAARREKLRGQLHEDIGFYYEEDLAGNHTVVSSFTLRPTRIVIDDHNTHLLVTDIFGEGNRLLLADYTWRREAWTSKRAFLAALPLPEMQWTGSDDNVQGVLKLLMAQVEAGSIERVRGTPVLGFHKTERGARFVTPQATFCEAGPLEASDLIYLPSGSTLAARVRFGAFEPSELRELARQAVPLLLAVNSPKVIQPAIGWFMAALFKEQLQERLGHFPILQIWGSQGCGKSTLATRVLWPLFCGVATNTDPLSSTESKFVMVRQMSASNAIALVYDEYKPADMGPIATQQLLRFLRRAYSGEVEERGRADQSTISYPLKAPICLCGEAAIDGDPALAERLILINPDKNWLDLHAESREAFAALDRLPTWKLTSSMLTWSLRCEIDALLEQARSVTARTLTEIGRKVPIRVKDNLAIVVFGLLAFEGWAQSLEVTINTSPADFFAAIAGVVDEVLGTEGTAVKDALDELLEVASLLAHRGEIKEGRDYGWIDGQLCIHKRSVLAAYQLWCRDHGEIVRTNGPRALTRIAAEKLAGGNSYVVALDKVVELDGRVRCLVIDPQRIPASLDAPEWPRAKDRTWGGVRKGDEWIGRWHAGNEDN